MLSVILFIYDTDKTRKVIFCILSILIFSNWIACLSRAGYLGVISSILILFVIAVLRFYLLKKEIDRAFIKSLSKKTAVIISFLIVLFFVLDISSKNTIFKQFSRSYLEKAKNETVSTRDEIKDVKITPDTIYYSTTNTEMRIKLISNDLQFYTGNGIRLNPTFYDIASVYVFDNYPHRFLLDQNNILHLYYNGALLRIAITNEGFKFFDERYGFPALREAPSWGFEGMERMATNRGYLWSRTIPLLKDVIFLGNGPDTYAFYFPQQDYMGKLKYCDNPYLIVDKPHNMYLQIAMNTGLVSLVCVLIIFISYIATSIKIYLSNNVQSVYSAVSLGVFLGTSAYMITAVFNDSIISVAPVFWIMLGIGHAANFVIIRENKKPNMKR
jgi:hypothetical protein